MLIPKSLLRSFSLKSAFIAIGAVLVLTGCGELSQNQTIIWSPDGNYAILRASDGVRIVNRQGRLGQVILKGFSKPVVWMPDSKGLVAVGERTIQTWEEFETYFSASTKDKVVKASEFFIGIAQRYKTIESMDDLNEDDNKQVDAILKTVRLQDVMAYLFYKDKKSFDKLFNKTMKDAIAWEPKITSIETLLLKNDKVVSNKMLYKALSEVRGLAVSPNGKALAVVEADFYKNKNQPVLKILSMNGKETLDVSVGVQPRIQWFKKNNQIVFFKDSGDSKGEYGFLCWAQVLNSRGKILREAEIEELAAISLDGRNNLRATGSGRVFFSGKKVSLPKSPVQKEKRHSLFMLEPSRMPTVIEVLSGTSYSGGCDKFDASPDGKQVVVLDNEGKVLLVDVKSAKVRKLQTLKMNKKAFKRSAILPQYRSNKELCFSRPVKPLADLQSEKKDAEADGRIAEIVLLNLSNQRTKELSKSWPNQAVEFLYKVKEKENSSRPTSKISE